MSLFNNRQFIALAAVAVAGVFFARKAVAEVIQEKTDPLTAVFSQNPKTLQAARDRFFQRQTDAGLVPDLLAFSKERGF